MVRMHARAQTYVYVYRSCPDELRALIESEVSSNPPIGYEPAEAVEMFIGNAQREMSASEEEVSVTHTHTHKRTHTRACATAIA